MTTQQQTKERTAEPPTLPTSTPNGSMSLAVHSPLEQAISLYDTPAQIAVIKRQICPDATPDEMWLFLARCVALELDPFSRQLYFIKRQNRNGPATVSHQIGVDGFRSIADRTGELVGISEPEFELDEHGSPLVARVTVLREQNGKDRHYVGVARWSEFYPGDAIGFMWKKMPFHMLSKCAEAQAMRRAFPQKMAGLTSDVEASNGDQVFAAMVREVEERRGQPAEGQYIDVTDTSTGEMKTVRAGDEYQRLHGEIDDSPSIGCTQCGAVKSTPQAHKMTCPTIKVEDEKPPEPERPTRRRAEPEQAPVAPAVAPTDKRVEERIANGLCTHPECVEADTKNQAADDTDPPRCLNHIDLPF